MAFSPATPHPAIAGGDLDDFLADLARQEAAKKTVANYRSDLRGFARWLKDATGEDFAAAAITPTDVRDYKGFLQTTQGRAPATINRRLAALRTFFRWAIGAGRVGEDPTLQVRGVKSVPRGPRSLDKRDVDRLVRAVEKNQSKRNLAIVQTLRHTGLRVGELCALRLGDVEISARKGAVTVRSGKGSKHRVVPLNHDARQAIGAYLEVRPKVTDDHLFIGQRGEPLRPQGVELLVKQYARQAGLTDVTPHVLRHSFAKQALDAGVDLVAVATLLGHQRLETTAIYTKPSARDLEKAVARLETR
jgi:site-specific recombinase XerD